MNKISDIFSKFIPKKNIAIPHWLLSLVASLYLTVVFNGHLAGIINGNRIGNIYQNIAFTMAFYIILTAIFSTVLSLTSFKRVQKFIIIILLMSSSITSYFMDSYHIVIDKVMIINTMETDFDESLELFSWNLIAYVAVTGILPSILIYLVKVRYASFGKNIITNSLSVASSVTIIGLITIIFYQDLSSLLRNNRTLRDQIIPINYINSVQAYIVSRIPKAQHQFTHIGLDAQRPNNDQHKGALSELAHKKTVTFLIVGETARSANFSLLGYNRITNPELSKMDIISFSGFSSCGTSTAISLPCMFSRMDRSNFDKSESHYQDNLLDIAQRSGLRVIWKDNNSGCKGVCDRVESIDTNEAQSKQCEGKECYDMILLENLDETIAQLDQDTLVVLHQKGSHGPTYHLRTPKEFKVFKPYCHTNQLQECSQQEIINAYDNTILYTDHFIAEAISLLEKNSDRFDSNLIYISDHGESLGENNLYLHGLPYMVAPSYQTQVPFIFWSNNRFNNLTTIDKNCLENKKNNEFSHDNLFDSVLGLLQISTNSYIEKNDIFKSCQNPSMSHIAKVEPQNEY